MDDHDVETFTAAARVVADLVGHPEVARRWDDESACAGMTVGGLAHHLLRQVTNTLMLLSEPPHPDQQPIPLLGHYERASWTHTGLDGEANVGIREGSNADAVEGPAALRDLVARSMAELPAALRAPRVPDTIHPPWQAWSLTTHDWVVTRLMEMVVHADDLAVSVDVPTPDLPLEVYEPVLAQLTRMSVELHGPVAVLRALARRERAPETIAAI